MVNFHPFFFRKWSVLEGARDNTVNVTVHRRLCYSEDINKLDLDSAYEEGLNMVPVYSSPVSTGNPKNHYHIV